MRKGKKKKKKKTWISWVDRKGRRRGALTLTLPYTYPATHVGYAARGRIRWARAICACVIYRGKSG